MIKNFISKKIIFLGLILFLIFIFNANSMENKIILKVNDQIITSIDINNEIKYLSVLNTSLKNLGKDEVFKIAKNSIIREKIKEIEIKKSNKNLKINNLYIDQVIKNIYLNLNLNNLDEFKIYLSKNNLDLNKVKKKISIEALWNEIIFIKFSSKVKINEGDIKNKLKKENFRKKIYELYEIIFEVSKNDEIKKKFKIIKNDIDKNGFENAALIHSISSTSKMGGKLGWIEEKSLNKIIKDKIKTLKDGEYTNPIVIPGGVLILKVKSTKSEEVNFNFDEEFKKLINIEKNQQLNQFSNLYFNKIKKNINLNEI